MHWDSVMAVVKDAALTGTGIAMLLSQTYSRHPSDIVLTAALVLIGLPGGHAAASVLAGVHGRTGGASSESQSPHSQPPSGSSSQGGAGNG